MKMHEFEHEIINRIHVGFIWGSHVKTMWKPCKKHIESMWHEFGKHMEITWFDHMETTWEHMGTMCFSCGNTDENHMFFPMLKTHANHIKPHGNHLAQTLDTHVLITWLDHVETTWDHMGAMWFSCGNTRGKHVNNIFTIHLENTWSDHMFPIWLTTCFTHGKHVAVLSGH